MPDRYMGEVCLYCIYQAFPMLKNHFLTERQTIMEVWESTIEKVIGYTFKNKALLRQAFTRRSFTQENGGQNNEILEFIGDKVLDVTVVKILTDSFGEINDDGEFQTINGESEGKLTQIKASLVERKSLAFRMKMLDLARFLRMGKGDILNHIEDQEKVQEDLFEAIIGAVALDCGWNMTVVSDVTERMLAIGYELPETIADFEENPVALVQDWMQKKLGLTPKYEFEYDEQKDCFIAYLCVPHPEFKKIFWGNGASKSIAREETAYSVWAYIQEHLEARAVAPFEVTKEMAINTLQELAQKGYIEFPEYDFSSYGADHIPSWHCTCTLPKRGYTITENSTNKKEAKREAAYKMLLLLKKEI